jgi:hypothetical protein
MFHCRVAAVCHDVAVLYYMHGQQSGKLKLTWHVCESHVAAWSVQSDVQPVWKPQAPPAAAAGGRRLHGSGPIKGNVWVGVANKAHIERIEELLKAGVVPEWQQAAQAGMRLHGQNPTNNAQIERIEELLKVRAVLQC